MRKSVRALALVLPLMLVAAACGDDDETTTTEAAATATTEAAGTEATEPAATEPAAGGEGLAAAQAVVDANLTFPTDIGPTIPLESTPEVKTIAWLECSLPSCIQIGVGFKNAAEAIGWNLEVISWSTDAAAAFQQAIDLGVDYVAISGTAPALIQDQLDQAKELGIPLLSCFDTTVPSADNNILIQCGDATFVEYLAGVGANAVIADSGAAANVLFVNIPDFAVLVTGRESAKATYAANCPDCTFNELALTLDQLLAGEVPGAVLSAVQADPSVDYISLAFDGLAGGVTATLAEADLLEGRKVVGGDFSGPILQEIVDGTMAFWTANPKEYSAWLMVDAAARHSIGQENTEERANAVLPSFIVNTAEVAQPLVATDGWPGPETMADQFAALWGK